MTIWLPAVVSLLAGVYAQAEGLQPATVEAQPLPPQAPHHPSPTPAVPQPPYDQPAPQPYHDVAPAPIPAPGSPAPVSPGPLIDRERTANQRFTVYGFAGILSKGQVPVGGGIKIMRLRWKNTYFTIANLTFAWTPNPKDSAGLFGYFIESGWKFSAGDEGQHVFYLGVEAGLGAVGYDIKTSSGRRTHTAMTLHPLSPHLEYNYHFADHVAFTCEIKAIPPILDGGNAARNGQKDVIVDRPPWLFGVRMGFAF